MYICHILCKEDKHIVDYVREVYGFKLFDVLNDIIDEFNGHEVIEVRVKQKGV